MGIKYQVSLIGVCIVSPHSSPKNCEVYKEEIGPIEQIEGAIIID